jgi:xylan 1,4-beta-xylosidase
MRIKTLIIFSLVSLSMSAQAPKQALKVNEQRPKTFCNPLDLAYRFQLEGSQREAADPVIVLYKGLYWLFASKSGGYWHSSDLVHWKFTEPEGLPLEIYAPTVVDMNNKLYYLAGNGVFATSDPESGKWSQVATLKYGVSDPALFLDDDGRLYLYHGCNENKPLMAVELDTQKFLPIGKELEVIQPDLQKRGWEVAGDANLGKIEGDTTVKNLLPWIEGSWMNKINGKYYLQYSAPGTQFKSYADGVFVSDSPMGPFTYASYSPFSYKPAGFVTGTGHSATFSDKDGQYWHVTTVTISVRHMFERRLALFPSGMISDGQLVANTYLGDYPQFVPGTAKKPLQNNSPRWMLLSYNKPATASSTLKSIEELNFNPSNAFDEEIRTWWAAATGDQGEWLQVDLVKNCRIDAIQINFADQGAKAFGRLHNDGYQYYVEASSDGKKWKTIIDRRSVAYDEPHHYIQLDNPEKARYVRITNVHSPAGSVFSLYDLRIFGSGLGKLPSLVTGLTVKRDPADPRRVSLSWHTTPDSDFYIVRYGIAPDQLFSNYQVYKSNSVDINSLNVGVKYYFTVDAVNDTGVTQGDKTILAE